MRSIRGFAHLAALLLALALPAAAAEPTLPRLPAGQVELHGTLDGAEFWARLLPPDAAYGGNRILQLVWQPPAPDRLAGAHVSDCPFVLLDEHARVVAFNGRETMAQALPAAPDGYSVTRELADGEGQDARPLPEERTVRGERGWDLHLAPVLLALAWDPRTQTRVRVVDLFGARHEEAMLATWDGTRGELAGAALTIEVDDAGALRRILGADGQPRLAVAGRTVGGPPTPAPSQPPGAAP